MSTFQDVFKKGFLNNSETEITPIGILSVMLISLLVSAFIYIIYKKCYRGVIYSHNFNISVAMMTIITAMLIITISTNIILSLGMVGALSIVRFRTAIKDPVDLMFLFWAVAAGIGIGARAFYVVLVGNIAIGLTFIILTMFKKENLLFLLIINFKPSANDEIINYLSEYKYSLRAKRTMNEMTEMTVEIRLKSNETVVVENINHIEDVINASLISYNGDFAQ